MLNYGAHYLDFDIMYYVRVNNKFKLLILNKNGEKSVVYFTHTINRYFQRL